MNRDKKMMYAVGAVAGAAFAVWVGVPPYLLLVLACPVMMFFMMGSMSHGNDRNNADAPRDGTGSGTRTTSPDGSHDRIDQP